MREHTLHDYDNPGPMKFTFWVELLIHVNEHSVTGYAIDADGTVVNFKKGKRKGSKGNWIPVV